MCGKNLAGMHYADAYLRRASGEVVIIASFESQECATEFIEAVQAPENIRVALA